MTLNNIQWQNHCLGQKPYSEKVKEHVEFVLWVQFTSGLKETVALNITLSRAPIIPDNWDVCYHCMVVEDEVAWTDAKNSMAVLFADQ